MIKFTKTKKIIATVILTCLVFLTVSFAFVYTGPQAQAVDIFGAIFWPIKVAIDWSTKIGNVIDKALGKSGAIAYKNALRYFLGKVAEDTAIRIATGDKGQAPLFYEKEFGEYMWGKDGILDQVAGKFLSDLFSIGQVGHCENDQNKECRSDLNCDILPGERERLNAIMQARVVAGQDVDDIGIEPAHYACILPKTAVAVCNPSSVGAKLEIHAGIGQDQQVVAPSCKWSKITEGWEKAVDSKTFLQDTKIVFQPEQNDFGIWFEAKSKLLENITQKQTASTKEFEQSEGGFKSILSTVSGFVKTPSAAVKKLAEQPIENASVAEETFTGQIWADAIGVFTNTLATKLLDKYTKQGMWNLKQLLGGEGSSGSGFLGSVGNILLSQSPLSAAKEMFAVFGKPSYSFDVGMSLQELSMEGPGQFNNVIDDSFIQAVSQVISLREAIEDGLIDDKAIFGFDEAGVSPEVGSGIPYRSMLVLRKFRIIPVGWELAAEYYRDFGRFSGERLTLEKLIDNFDNPDSPYYGLVDPNWLLKMPPTRCVRQGASPQKMEQDPYCIPSTESTQSASNVGTCDGELIYPFQRLENYCADYESCLSESGSGNCDSNSWGYCLEEESIWKIDGDLCRNKFFASCSSMTNLSDNSKENYLINTLSEADGICNAGNSGCREYCSLLNSLGDWECSTNDLVYLDDDSSNCSSSVEGCSMFYASLIKNAADVQDAFDNRSSDGAYNLLTQSYYKLAPDYYSCDGYTNPVSPQPADEAACIAQGNYWRKDLKLCVQSGSEDCSRFVKHCESDDVNCQLYKSISSSDPDVPAVIIPKGCLGSATGDCSDEADLNIIWNDECPASCVGYQTYSRMSTNFENAGTDDLIASTAQTCSNPGCDEFTNLDEVARGGEGIEYYSYLRQCIKPEAGGYGTYYTWEGSDTTGYALKKWELKLGTDGGPLVVDGHTTCSLTDQDCREFFDKDLTSYKRYYSKTVVVSDDCHPFRRTIVNSADCSGSGGSWEGGQCIYMALPSESTTCGGGDAGCREFKSNYGYSYEKILESYFSQAGDEEDWVGGTSSSESVRRGDYSLKVDGFITRDLAGGDLEEGKLYTLQFLAKGSGTISASFINGSTEVNSAATSNLTSEWLYYELKLPASRTTGLEETEVDNDSIRISGSNFYIDNIVLKKMQSILLIKDSWVTPAECSNSSGGATHIGCQAYSADGQRINLRSFNSLCFEDVVGCELVINTDNSYQIDDDSLDYLVLSDSYKCEEQDRGCTHLGLMTPDREDAAIYTYEDKYKIVDIYNSQGICTADEVLCQTYKDDSGGVYNFRNPLERTCEFKKVAGETKYKWYKSGTEEECSGAPMSDIYEKHCLGGVSLKEDGTCESDSDCMSLAYPSDPDGGVCVDWVGLCDSASTGCKQYQDPQVPQNCDNDLIDYAVGYCESGDRQCLIDSSGQTFGCLGTQFCLTGYCFNNPDTYCDSDADCGTSYCLSLNVCNYYYYKNVETCSSVNPDEGCAGFYQTDGPEATIRSYKVCVDSNNTPIIPPQACNTDRDCSNGERCKYSSATY